MQKIQNPKVAEGVLFQEVNGEMVLLHLGAESYFGLNEVGVRIWNFLGEGLDESDITNRLADEFDVPKEQIAADVSGLLHDLLQAGLLEVPV